MHAQVCNGKCKDAGAPREVLLIPVAKAIADLVCLEDFSDVKGCEGQGCTLFFLDKTRARAAALVQHGDLRQPREAGRASKEGQAQARSAGAEIIA
jgi:predicted RNA-binding Zn ribbon-like protein